VAAVSLNNESEVAGRTFTTSAVSGSDGMYAVDAFQGNVEVHVTDPAAGSGFSSAALTGDTVLDVELLPPELVELTVDLSTRFAGETTSIPVDIDWRQGIHFDLRYTTSSGLGEGLGQNVTTILVPIGDDVTVCASGRESGLSSVCATVTPSSGAATAVLQMVQAARVEGNVRLSDGSVPDQWSASVSVVNPDGSLGDTYGTDTHPNGGLSVGLLVPGDYEIAINGHTSGARERATLQVSASDGDVIDVGVVALTPPGGRFGSERVSGVTVSPREIVGGDIVNVRLAAHNGDNDAVSEAVVSIQVPDGTTVVPDSVLLDGVAVDSTSNGGWLEVDVGEVASAATAVMQVWLQTDADLSAEQLVMPGRISYTSGGPVTEPLGLGAAVVRHVTIEAPRITDVRTLSVGGRAPADSAVIVTADGVNLATTTATPGGLWWTKITLPETPLPRGWALVAEADTLPDPTRSAPRPIFWDKNYNPLQRVVMKQDGGASVEFRTVDGVAHFPFVVNPSESINVRLYFKDPDRVDWATVSIGTSTAGRGGAILRGSAPECFSAVGALARRDLCYWEATIIPRADDLGDLHFAWDSEVIPLDLSPTPLPPPLTVDQVRSQLRPPFNTFTDLVVVDEPSGTDIQAALDALEVDLNVTVTAAPGNYTPTLGDVNAETATGVPIYGLATTLVENDDLFEVHATFFIPDSPNAAPGVEVPGQFTEVVFLAATQAAAVAPNSAAEQRLIENAAAISSLIINTADLTNAGLSAATNPWDVLEEAADNVFEFCTPEVAAQFQQRIDQIVTNLKIQFGVSVAAAIIGLATGPIGAVVLFLVGTGLDQSMADIIGRQIEGLINDMVNNPLCQIPPKRTPPGDKGASPTWIYDPSGFVFELFEDVRLEGVTATVQHADDPGGPWGIWDADWFGQSNPLITDGVGAYGWDVPVGWWRVRFDRVGYETAYSDVLEVLPPHFDVNVGLTSLASPGIATVGAAPGDAFIDVTFEGWMLSAFLDEFNVTLVGPGDAVVPFTLEPMGPRVTEGGDDVLRMLRFNLEGPLVLDDFFTVTIDRAAQTYAGIPGDGEIVVRFQVEAPPPPPTTTTTTQPGSGGTIPATGLMNATRTTVSVGLGLLLLGLLVLLGGAVLGTRRHRWN
jgi:hypothetical protein